MLRCTILGIESEIPNKKPLRNTLSGLEYLVGAPKVKKLW
jgi:hypothetical protein